MNTIKYGSNPWTKSYDAHGGNSDWAPRLAMGSDDQVVMGCTARLDGFRIVWRLAKYNATSGAETWTKDTTVLTGRPTNNLTDTLTDIAVDYAGDVVAIGNTASPAVTRDYLTVKFSGIDGAVDWQQQLNGDATTGDDQVAALALSAAGDVVVTGTMARANQSNYFHIGTARYNRLALSKGDRVKGYGLSAAAVVNTLGSPAISYDGAIVSKLTVKDGSKILNGIINTKTGNIVDVLQGQPAPGITNAKFASFTDPVTVGDDYAFMANVTGAPTGQTSGLWYDRASGNGPALIIQVGKQAPALPAGVLVSSIVNFDTIGYGVVAHITLKGTGVTTASNSAVVQWTVANGNVLVMRTGSSHTIDGKTSNLKTISIFSPPTGSAGQSRYAGNGEVTMKLTLVDGRNVITNVRPGTTTTYKAVSGGAADSIVSGGKWATFTQPSIGQNGGKCALLGTLKPGIAGVTTANDSIIAYSATSPDAYAIFAREGGAAKDIAGATFATLSVPVTNSSLSIAFAATVKGPGITTANNAGIWKATSGVNHTLVARTGDLAPDAYGVDSTRVFASFTSIAYPSLATGPLFRSTLKGPGVTTANNSAVFAHDSDFYLRQILRTGDKMGTLTIKSFSLLNPAAKAMNATRSFTTTNNITALVTFTDLSQSIVRIDVP